MLERVALVRTDVSEGQRLCHPDDGGATFLRNVAIISQKTAFFIVPAVKISTLI
jgi:hypothetical protein